MVDLSSALHLFPSREQVVGSLDAVAAGRQAARVFVAGDGVEAAARAVSDAVATGMTASVLYLPADRARETTALVSMQAIGALAAGDVALGNDLAVNPAALGLGRLPQEAVVQTLTGLCRAAREAGMTVTLTSVPHSLVKEALGLWAAMVGEFPDLAVTLTANLHRTEGDCLDLANRGARVRLLRKEAVEHPGVAFADEHEIDKAFVRCARLLLAHGARPIITTEDPRLIEIAGALAQGADRIPGDYVFQFRRGAAQSQSQAQDLVASGEAVSILVPFGPDWARYVSRWIELTPGTLGRAAGAAIGRVDA